MLWKARRERAVEVSVCYSCYAFPLPRTHPPLRPHTPTTHTGSPHRPPPPCSGRLCSCAASSPLKPFSCRCRYRRPPPPRLRLRDCTPPASALRPSLNSTCAMESCPKKKILPSVWPGKRSGRPSTSPTSRLVSGGQDGKEGRGGGREGGDRRGDSEKFIYALEGKEREFTRRKGCHTKINTSRSPHSHPYHPPPTLQQHKTP